MRRWFTFATICAIVSGGASVAAQSQKTPLDWTGFYVGINPGVGNGGATFDPYSIQFNQLSGIFVPGRGIVIVPATTVPMPIASVSAAVTTAVVGGPGIASAQLGLADAFFGFGVQAGFNHARGRLLWGVEGDYTGGSTSGSSGAVFTTPLTALQEGVTVIVQRSVRIPWGASIRGRAGFVLDRDMVYVTGGLALANVMVSGTESIAANPSLTDTTFPCPGANCSSNLAVDPYSNTTSQSQTHKGLVFGIGWERLLGRILTIGVEYRHASLGGQSYSVGATTITETCASLNTSTNPLSCDPGGHSIGTLGADTVRVSSNLFQVRANLRLPNLKRP